MFAYAGLEGYQQLYPDALATLRKARQLDARSEGIPYQMAVTYALMHRYDEARQACEETLRLATQRDDVYFLIGVIKLEEGDFRAAEKSLRQAMDLNPRAASFHTALGVALFEATDLAGSRKELD